MKPLINSFCLILSASISLNAIGQVKGIEFREIRSGIATVNKVAEEKLKGSPTGTHNFIDEFEITTITDSVPAVVGTSFGTEYVMRAAETKVIDLQVEWIFPATITNAAGESYDRLKYTTSRSTNYTTFSSYTLDESYETVKGKWEMRIYYKGKLLFSKNYFLF